MLEPKIIKMLALVTQIGISMLVPVFLMVWFGVWVDGKFGTQLFPLFLLLGIGGGFRSVYTLIVQAGKDRSMEKEDGDTDE